MNATRMASPTPLLLRILAGDVEVPWTDRGQPRLMMASGRGGIEPSRGKRPCTCQPIPNRLGKELRHLRIDDRRPG